MPRNYHWALMTDEERRDAARDLGVALESVARILYSSPPMARVAATQALPLLEEAVRDHPDDLTARESLGYALGVLNRRQDVAPRLRRDPPPLNRHVSWPSIPMLGC